MREKYLPIGTVVLLKEATKRLMITGYCSAKPDDPNTIYDYVGVLFPEGNLVGDDVALFNHDQIGTIAHMGLDDDEFRTLEKNIKEALTNDETSLEQPASQPAETPTLTPFTPDNINNILEQIKSQGDAFKPISEPTAFNEEVIKKPVFEMPTLDGSSTKKEEKDQEQEEENSDFPIDEAVKVESVADGQPVLQLQPIFTDEANPSGESAPAAPVAPATVEIPGLSRL